MQRKQPSPLNPDLVIDQETAIDRMLHTASLAVESSNYNFPKIVKLVRTYARNLCPAYKNCRKEDWCMLCASGSKGSFFMGATCLHCKLLTSDARIKNKQTLAQISQAANINEDQRKPLNEI